MKTIILLALGATFVGVSSASAAASEPSGEPVFVVATSGATMAAPQAYRNCDCNLPVLTVPFYSVRPAGPDVRVRAPGVRVSSAPVFVQSPSLYIQSPPIYVDAPPVTVAPAQVYLEAPDVHVRPSEVTVAPPVVNFAPASNTPDDCCRTTTAPVAPGTVAPARPYQAPVSDPYRQEDGERG